MIKLKIIVLFMALTGLSVPAFAKSKVWDITDFGAKGNGQTVNTKAIQKTIDACAQAGGGVVYVRGGKYVTGTIYLKSNITLHIEPGAVLLGSPNVADYPDMRSAYPTYGTDTVTSKSLIYAENLENIAIEGNGIINGNGAEIDTRKLKDKQPYPSFMYRPRILHIRGCKNVFVKDVQIKNSASWVQTYQACTNLVIQNISVESRENPDISQVVREYEEPHRNTDGLDLVDCQLVRVSNCYINSGDDALCIKSFSPDRFCRDITVTNCVFSSNASGIKIGTETAGMIQDITIQNCVVFDTRGEGIAVMTADGATVERVNISNITLRNIKRAAIFIRLNKRDRLYGTHTKVNQPVLKNIMIDNIQASRVATLGCSVTGLKDNMLENVAISNVTIEFEGGVKKYDGAKVVPEPVNAYPVGNMFGNTLPAYGFFIRNVKDVSLRNITLRLVKDDIRPAIVGENIAGLDIDGLKANGSAAPVGLIQLTKVADARIRNCLPLNPIPVFLKLAGTGSENITLTTNYLRNAAAVFQATDGNAVIKESGTIK